MKLKHLPIYLSLALILGIFIGRNSFRNPISNTSSSNGGSGAISEIIEIIDNEYIDSIDVKKLEEDVIKSFLTELDPHSYYIPPSNLSDVNESMNGNFSGVGIEYRIIHDTLTVIRSIKGGPAFNAGIKMGDQIVAVNDDVLDLTTGDVDNTLKSLRGEPGSTVILDVLNKFKNTREKVEVIRGEIPITSVAACYRLEKNQLLIKLNRFSGETYNEFVDSLNKYAEGTEELIIDLRNNGGGRLSSAIQIAQLFLKEGQLITYTEGAHQKREDHLAMIDGAYQDLRLKILMNENSASASEVLAGALKHHQKAVIIGTNSFGKGLVQQQYDLSNGGAFRLVVAKYYTPDGVCIQRPYKNMSDADYYHQELDSVKYGIQPHILVEEDTSFNYTLLSSIYNQDLVDRTFEYATQYQDQFKSYSVEDYLKNKETITRSLVGEHELNDKDFNYLCLLVVGDISKYIHGDSFEEKINLMGENIYRELK